MIGRLRQRLQVFGTRSAVGPEALVTRVNNLPGQKPLSLAFDWKVEADSDHYSFLQRGIPTLMFHTGLHDDYHRPSDDVQFVNLAGLEPVTCLTLAALLEVADSPEERLEFRSRCLEESNASRSRLETAAFLPADKPGRWGVGTRLDDANPAVPVVVAVRNDSPAARGGLRIKDRILAINDQSLRDQQDMVSRLSEVPPGGIVEVTVAREGRVLPLMWRE